MYRVILGVLFFLFYFLSYGKDIRIGVYRENNIQQIEFSYYKESYKIFGDTSSFGNILPNEFISITKEGKKVRLKKGVQSIGLFDSIRVVSSVKDCALRLRPISPTLKEKKYQDNFVIFSSTKGLTIVNQVSFTHYLEGVIESEGGGGKHIEYYKVQAIISRTYALRHFQKHAKEGFNLCNQVHCQAYHNMLQYTNDIKTAVEATEGIYMVDTIDNKIIEAFFHANCGGETSTADYVWKQDVHYLQSVKDTFCIYTSQATWEKRIPKVAWRNFLVNNYFYPIEDSVYASVVYSFSQEHRKAFYLTPSLGIPLRDLRQQFKLRSTFFSCYPEGNNVVLKGRGYGHGVGLCQEGAMNMAKAGYSYQQILSFYYSGIAFQNSYENLFFRQIPGDVTNF
ncbi:MAG: SpoIID/LytB domain-containing protein [Brumimicrobium sp.]|nr:SpoIID/LytB domain-containing protein [Brumimicrobium sp.]